MKIKKTSTTKKISVILLAFMLMVMPNLNYANSVNIGKYNSNSNAISANSIYSATNIIEEDAIPAIVAVAAVVFVAAFAYGVYVGWNSWHVVDPNLETYNDANYISGDFSTFDN